MSFGRDTEPGEIDLSCPINWDHPDNTGLALCLSAVAGTAGGAKFLDLCRLGDRTAGGPLVNGPTWVGTPWGQSGLSFTAASSQMASVAVPAINSSAAATFSCWVYKSSNSFMVGAGCAGGASSGGSRFVFNWYTDGRVYCAAENGSVCYAYFGVGSSGWHRITMRFDGSQSGNLNRLKVWADGVQETLEFYGTIPQVLATNASPFAFGRDATDRYCGGICAGGLLWPTRALPDRAIVDDYQWSRDPATDPRLNRITGRTYYLPLSATPSVFAPAFGPGWGFAA